MNEDKSLEEAMRTPLPAEVEEDVTQTTAGANTIEGRDRQNTTTAFEPLRTSRQEAIGKATIVLKTHDGVGYVLPYLPWEASLQNFLTTKLQVEQIYSLRHREKLAEAVKDGNFSMLTESGDIILPSLWDLVVKPSATVQISLPSEILNPEIASYHTNEDEVRTRYRQPCPSVVHSNDYTANPEEEKVEIVVDTSNDDDSESDEESDMESTSSWSKSSEGPALTETPLEIARPAITPLDGDGNELSFQVNTAFIGPLNRGTTDINNLPNKREPQQSVGNVDYLGITKVVSTEAEGRTTLQVHVLPGPRSTSTHPDVSVRWYHVYSERLDLTRFKNTCLGITGLSERLHKLLRKLFEKVEKEKLKVFLGGMYIEPGTMLRADESHQSDPQSVIFSCIPYFDLSTPAKKSSSAGQTNGFPSRTLMQSYYPYEPVQERDAEQAYRKFGNEQRNALVHVPNMWMVNIGPNIVVTCGHQALSKGFGQSIEVVEVNRNHTRKEEDHTTNIRLTDWDGRKLLYTLEECRSYFQMEQKLKELRWCSNRSRDGKSVQLSWKTSNGSVKVTPGLWIDILRQKDVLFIDLAVANKMKEDNKDEAIAQLPSTTVLSANPFFHWPQTTGSGDLKAGGFISDEIKRPMQCLEHVEKAMLSEVLSSYGSYNAVEETFTTTTYYRTLPEDTAEHVKSIIKLHLAANGELTKATATGHTIHQALVIRQHNVIAQKASELYEIMHKTLALFVADLDNTTMLRKSWGALRNICDIAVTTCRREPLSHVSDEETDPGRSHRFATYQGWFVRPDFNNLGTSTPLRTLERTFEKCKKCRTTKMYSTSQAALLHLQKHLKQLNASNYDPLVTEQWVISYAQMKMETWNEGVVAVLTKACQTTQQLFIRAKDLSDGVRNEDGQMSYLYTFPRPLLTAFRQLLILYFAVERAMYYTEEEFKDERNAFEWPEYMTALPFSSSGLRVIEAFGNGVQQAITSARNELCSMVKSKGPVGIFKRLSLSPEYVCSWLMRRLIVKPLEKSMNLSDMYREYLSTIQFQVNHRPGKRLLRSINLLQEELTALQEVNTQQSKLILNYMRVLDDATYEKDIPNRRAMFPYERMLLASCQDSLQLTDQEYRYLLARCGPLLDNTKQSVEINEEDHGKAIMVFTVVTVIFLPLSFVTSFLGMNTTDIRDMGSSSMLFWAIAVPLTAVTMGSVLYIGYNGDELRDTFSAIYRFLTGKQDRSTSARGISVVQRKRARKSATDSNTTLNLSSLADEAEFANPQPDSYHHRQGFFEEDTLLTQPPRLEYTVEPPTTTQWEQYVSAATPLIPEPRANLRAQTFGAPAYDPPTKPRPTDKGDDYADWYRRDQWARGTRHVSKPPRQHYGRRASEFLKPEVHYTSGLRRSMTQGHGVTPNIDIYNVARPEVQTYNEPIRMEDRPIRARYSPPPPPMQPGVWDQEEEWYTRTGTEERHSVPPLQYEWMKKSHRRHRSAGKGTRRRRDEGWGRWDDIDEDA